ncbi:unnamed protein product [Lota lota]
MSLSGKTDAEISQLLTKHGVKHGPIVGSTRSLYEKKLIAAMDNKSERTPSDKTYYREEVDEVTYVSYQTPVAQEAYGDTLRRRGSFEKVEEKEIDYHTKPQIPSSRTVNQSKVVEPIKKSGGCMPTALKLLVVVLLGLFFYYVFCSMENKGSPFELQP